MARDEIRHGQPHRRQPIGLHPDPHRVVAGAEDAHLADAGHAIERVDDVDVGVVGEEQRVVGLVRREQRHEHHRQAGDLAHREAELLDVGRQVRLRLRQPVLHVHLIDVRVGVDVERDRELHRAVVGVGRLHVEHVVDAVHLLLERRRDRLLDGDRVGAGVGGGDEDLRRHDVGEHARPAIGRIDTIPPRTVTIAMTMATMGRRTKNAAMVTSPRSPPAASSAVIRLGLTTDPSAELGRVDDHARAGLEALFDDPAVADSITERDGLQLHLVVRPDDAHLAPDPGVR